jgi:diguanylate cyclase (GGDEF)-like protein
MFRALLKPFVLSNPFERGLNDYWRVRLINIYLVLTTLVFGFFSLFNLFVVKLYPNAIADIIGLLFVIATVVYYQRTGRVNVTSSLVVSNIFLISFAIIVVAAKDYGILFWSIFVPIFSLFLLGRKRGLLYTALYYAALFAYLVTRLGEDISAHLLLEFIIISLVLVAVIYYYEFTRNEAYALIQQVSVEDPLTGLSNRRRFSALFEEELHRAQRNQTPFIFFIMDVDHFKSYNDSYGHHEGDKVLRQIAEVLKRYFRRSGDEVFRLGGEEFGGILSPGHHSDYLGYMEKLRQEIEALAIAHSASPAGVVTASFGLAIVTDASALTAMELYQKTDEALYLAKEKGRNRIDLTILPTG